MAIEFEKEVVDYLALPSIPKREWDGKTPFEHGVAVISLTGGREAYAACTFDEKTTNVRITKVFSLEPFKEIKKVFVVPTYMLNIDVDDVTMMDLEEGAQKMVTQLLNEAKEIENDGIDSETPNIEDLTEWIFPEINSKEEAQAWLRQYNKRNKIKGALPKSAENIKLRLYSIYTEMNNTK